MRCGRLVFSESSRIRRSTMGSGRIVFAATGSACIICLAVAGINLATLVALPAYASNCTTGCGTPQDICPVGSGACNGCQLATSCGTNYQKGSGAMIAGTDQGDDEYNLVSVVCQTNYSCSTNGTALGACTLVIGLGVTCNHGAPGTCTLCTSNAGTTQSVSDCQLVPCS